MNQKEPRPLQSDPVRTIVHLGAGRCSELDEYLEEAERIILVEADPELADALRKRAKDMPQVNVCEAAVASAEGPATFYRYNLPELSSLRPATGLMELFPGLKLVKQQLVDTRRATDLVAEFTISDDKKNTLVIDLPGEELSVLDSLNSNNSLQRFSELTLYCGREVLYEGGEPGQLVAQWLNDQGFDLAEKDESRDPERPVWRFRRNALALYARELQQERDDLAARVEQLTKAREEQSRLAAEQEKLAGEHHVQIEQLQKARDEQARVAAERQTNLQEANEALEASNQAKLDLEQRLEHANKARAEQEKLSSERRTQIEQLQQARDEQVRLAAERQAKLQEANEALEASNHAKAELQQRLEQANQARAEQEKLIGERRAQIKQLQEARDEQARLAAELQAKLQEANEALEARSHAKANLEQQLERTLAERQSQQDEFAKTAETALNEKSRAQQELDDQLQQTRNRVQQLEQALAEKEHVLNEKGKDLEAELAEKTNALNDGSKQLEQERARVQQLKKTLAENELRLAELAHKLDQQTEEVETLKAKEGDLNRELEEARQTALLSVKLQTLREADLEDLQARYRKSLEVQESQHQLLVKLSERLTAASAYFHQLSGEDPAFPFEDRPLASTNQLHSAPPANSIGRSGRKGKNARKTGKAAKRKKQKMAD